MRDFAPDDSGINNMSIYVSMCGSFRARHDFFVFNYIIFHMVNVPACTHDLVLYALYIIS